PSRLTDAVLALSTAPVGPSSRNVTDSSGVKPDNAPPVTVAGSDAKLCPAVIVNDANMLSALVVFALSPPAQLPRSGVSVNHHDPSGRPASTQLATPPSNDGVHVVDDTGV